MWIYCICQFSQLSCFNLNSACNACELEHNILSQFGGIAFDFTLESQQVVLQQRHQGDQTEMMSPSPQGK